MIINLTEERIARIEKPVEQCLKAVQADMENIATTLMMKSNLYIVYEAYKFNRDQGISFERMKLHCKDAELFEQRYQNER